jgi:peptidoglycan/LPS O-acetylase OafA/YrhL
VLGFSFTFAAALDGFVLDHTAASDDTCDLFAPALIGLALLLIAAAVHLTTVLTQRIDLLAGYNKKFLEPVLGMGWEARWREHRESFKRGGGRLPLGTSKALSYYYVTLIIAELGVYVAADGHECPERLPVVLVPALLALILAGDLHQRWSQRWVTPFDDPE